MRGVLALLSVLMIASLAGCVDESSEPPASMTPDDGIVLVDPETGAERIVRNVPVTFGAVEPYVLEEDVEGHFDLQEHGYPAGNVQRSAGVDPGNIHVYDITDKVPQNVPVRLVLEVDVALERGDLDIWFQVPFDEVWTSDFDTPYGGYSKVEQVIVHTSADPIMAMVRYDEYDTSQGFDYTLSLRVESDPSWLPPGVPVKVPVPNGAAAIELRFPDDVPERVWFWGPDDALVETTAPVDGKWNHTFTGRGGDYVLLVPQEAGPANVTLVVAHEGDERPRPVTFGLVKQEIIQTTPESFQANTPAETTFDVDRHPIQLGLQVDIDRVTNGFSGALEGPNGKIIDASFSDDLPFYSTSQSGVMMFTLLTQIGDPDLAMGPYTATFSGDPNGSGQISAWIVHYAR